MSRWGRCDFSELQELSKRLENAQRQEDRLIRELAKELAARFLRKAKKRTPVDTGNLRRKWNIGEIRDTGNGYEVEIINPTEYASYVEYGHRTRDHTGWVQGKFMMTKSEMELEQELPKIIEKKLRKFLEGASNGSNQ